MLRPEKLCGRWSPAAFRCGWRRPTLRDAGTMKRLLEDTRSTMPPLRGVIHSAACLDDGVLLQQSWDRFATVFAAKSHRQPATAPVDGVRRARFLCVVLVYRSCVRLARPGKSRGGERVHGYFGRRARGCGHAGSEHQLGSVGGGGRSG